MTYHLLSDRTRTAKKRHICIWCGEAIEPGTRYREERSVYEGNMQLHRWHLECDEAGAQHFREVDSEFFPHENERPPTPGELEYRSWDMAALPQYRLELVTFREKWKRICAGGPK